MSSCYFVAATKTLRNVILLPPTAIGSSSDKMSTTMERMTTKSYDAFLQQELRDPELAAAYLSAAIEDDSTEQFLIALRAVAEAHGGVSAIADAAHLNRQTMYRTLSRHGNPTISTLLPLLKAMGLHLSFAPAVG
jgi:probable addiction module antidote protein